MRLKKGKATSTTRAVSLALQKPLFPYLNLLVPTTSDISINGNGNRNGNGYYFLTEMGSKNGI